MPLLRERERELLSKKFSRELEGEVKLVVFLREDGCEYCGHVKELVEEVSQLSERIQTSFYDLDKDSEKAAKWEVDKAPATLIFGKQEYKVRYFGIPAGYEFTAFIEDIIDVSRGRTHLSPSTKQRISGIKTPIHIQVFVTPTCPYCPRAVRLAHQLAIESSMVKADMIESTEFPELAARYNVMAVPKVVINDVYYFEGALPEPQFVEYVMAVAEGRIDELPFSEYSGRIG